MKTTKVTKHVEKMKAETKQERARSARAEAEARFARIKAENRKNGIPPILIRI